MVLNHSLQHLLDLVKTTNVLSLPPFKQISFKIEYGENDKHNIKYSGSEPPLPFAASDIFYANISECRRLSVENPKCKDVYEVSFDITNSNINFKPGDTIGIIPHNVKSELDTIVRQLDLEDVLDKKYILSVDVDRKSKIPGHIPVEATLKHVLTHCVDFRGVVKKAFLLALSKYTKDEVERKILEYLCSKEGSSSYTAHILEKKICLIDLLITFKSCKPCVEVLLEHLPRLLPRPYSVVSSASKDKNTLKICFSVMDVGNNRKGLTTGWLQQSYSDDSIEGRMKSLSIETLKVPIYLRKNFGGFSLPQDLTVPIIMIGPGTGVAPYIGFLEEREVQRNSGLEIGYAWLFFGCRDPKLDYIYEKELTHFLNNSVLSRLSVAFSRIDKADSRYVQDDLMRNGEEVTKLIMEGAYVYLCGDVNKFSKEIQEVLTKCLEKHSGMTREDSQTFILNMKKHKRYLVDIWS